MKITTLFLFIILSTQIIAQNITLKGTVVDENNSPLPGASVALKQNNTIVSGASTNPMGVFTIQVPKGNYNLEISFISYTTINRTVDLSAGDALDLGQIKLQPSGMALDEVTVEARANVMEFKQDKRVFNVAQDASSVGGNASEILNNLPSVNVDIEGNVNLRGSSNVRILVDGKPSGLIGSDPASALRLLQSDMIERIEVITNPSARYDAEGDAGIINIVLKKQNQAGINGVFDVYTGYPENHGASAGINYRKGKINWFVNAGINYRNGPGGGFSDQTFYLQDTTYRRYTDREQNRGGTNASLRAGADFTISPSSTITGSFLYRPGLGKNISNLTYYEYDENGLLTGTSTRRDEETETGLNLEGDLHYENIFNDNDEHKLTADFKYQNADDLEESNVRQTYNDINTPDLLQRVSNQEDEQTILIQTDYVHPFTEKRKMEFGLKANLRDIINNYSVTEQGSDGGFDTIQNLNNNFRYLENVYAAYGIYGDGFGKITYQLGLRAEYSDIETQQIKENINNPKNYINFFPSAFVTYKVNKTNDFQINYSRRISRPWFRALLPFSNYSDNVNLRLGNPDLNPEYTDSYEVGYLNYFKKGSLYSGVYYRHRTNVTERIQLPNDTGTGTITRPVNLSVQDAYGFEFNYNYNFTDWYSVMANLNLFMAITTGSYEDVNYGNTNYSTSGNIMNRFNFWKSNLQLSFNYRGPSTSAQGRNKAMYSADFGWSKDILKGNATIQFSVRDIFNSRKWRGYIDTDALNSYQEFQWRRRQFTLGFSYRLNQKKERPKPGGNGGDMGDMDGF